MKALKRLTLAVLVVACSVWVAQALGVELHRTIKAPRQVIKGEDDKPGYTKDFGITNAFDISLPKKQLAAIIAETAGPTRLFIFDLETGQTKYQPTVSNNRSVKIRAVKFSPDGRLIAVPTGADKQISLWDASTGRVTDKQPTAGEAADVDWHPSGTALSVVAGKDIEIWGMNPLQKRKTIRGARGTTEFPMCARWSPDGAYLAIGTNAPAVYISKDGQQSPALSSGPKGAVYVVEWNTSGNRIAAAGFGTGGTIVVWDNPKAAVDSPFETRYSLARTFAPEPGQGWERLTWDPAGEKLAFGGSKTNFFIMDVASGTVLNTFAAHPKSKTLEAHWKGQFLFTVGAHPDKDFKIWKVR